MPLAARRSRAHELLERVGLLDRAGAQPASSGRRAAARRPCAALAHRPKLLIADEPTGDLDEAAREVHALLAELVAEERSSAIVVSHDPASTAIADRVVHIRDGRVAEERQGEVETAVVGTGGWLRIPEETLRAAGIHDRARIVLGDGSVGLHPVVGRDGAAVEPAVSLEGARGELLDVRGATRRYGSQIALDALDVTFLPGELTVVVGPSGSGKSTLLSLLSGMDVPDEGEVLWATWWSRGSAARSAPRFRSRSIAVIGQAPGLSGFLSARENVELGLALRGIEGDEASDRTAESLAAVGLAAHAERRVDLLSAGQRERVALARAFAARTPVVIADEPSSRLDAVTTVEIGSLLAELAHGRRRPSSAPPTIHSSSASPTARCGCRKRRG